MAEEKKEMQRVNISMFGLSYQLKTDDPARLKRLAASRRCPAACGALM